MTSGWIALLLLLLVIVFVAAAFAWQERTRLPERSVIYGTDDAVAYVSTHLSPETAEHLDERDVRRILEWQLEYLQRQMVEGDDAIVVAGLDAARHAQARLHEQGHTYDGRFIVEVMELQARYLVAIGAVAAPATPEDVADVFPDEPGSDEPGQHEPGAEDI